MIVESLKKSILYYAFSGKLTDNKSNINVEEELNKKGKNFWEYSTKQNFKIEEVKKEDEPFQLPNNWKWVRLHQVCSYIQRGKSPKYSKIEKYPVLAQKCNQWDGLHMERALFFDPNEINTYSKERILQQNDILINSTGGGSCGRIGMYDVNSHKYELAVADSHITVCRCYSDIINPKFIYYYMSSPMVQSIIESQAVGTTNQIELLIDTLRNYLIPFAPIDIQNKIVNKIEFIFTKLADVKPIEDDLVNIKNMFPSNMKNSILNSILSKYSNNIINLSEISTINGGYAFKSTEYIDNGVRVIRISDFDENGIKEDNEVRYKYNESLAQYKLNNNDIIMCMTGGTVGKNVLLENIPNDYYTNQRVATIKINDNFVPKFVYYCINAPFIQKMIQENKNSTNDNISMTLIKNFPIPNISIEEQKEVIEKIEKLLPLCNDIESLVKYD